MMSLFATQVSNLKKKRRCGMIANEKTLYKTKWHRN